MAELLHFIQVFIDISDVLKKSETFIFYSTLALTLSPPQSHECDIETSASQLRRRLLKAASELGLNFFCGM